MFATVQDWLFEKPKSIVSPSLEELVERTQRTFIKLSLGILGGILLLILFTWGGCHAYQRWEERHQVQRATVFLRDSDFKSAALSARRALQLNANSTGAMRVMAQLAEKSRDRSALDWRRKIVELEPDSRPDILALSNSALQLGDIHTAEKSLARIDDKGKQTAAFHAAAARLANARKNSAEAKNEFGKALRLAPDDESYQMEYALACLEQPVATEREEGLRILNKLRGSPAQRSAATRSLFLDGVARRHDPQELRSLAKDLQSYPGALFTDRLLYLDVLRRLRDPEYATYLTNIEKDASSKPADLAALLSWMSANNLSLIAIDFAKPLPQKILDQWPVPWALAEAYAKINDWPALEKLTKTANWDKFDFVRRAFLTRALRAENNAVAAGREWSETVKSASAQSQSLLLLARIINDWGWKDESLDLFWQLAKYPEVQFDALHTLYLHYANIHNTQGLYRVLSRLNEIDPGDLKVQNNLAQISLLLNVDLERARKWVSDLYGKEPANAAYVSTYAFSLYTKGDVKGALNVISKLREEELQEPSLAAYYGIFLAASGDKIKAREYLERGKKADLLPEEKTLIERAETALK
jgi:Flp pilus assembly protein TadD